MTSIGKRMAFLLLALSLFTAAQGVAAVTLISGGGMLSIDLPEGFRVTDAGSDGKSFQLENTVVPVSAVIRVYGRERFRTAKDALDDVLRKFKATADSDTFTWRNRDCMLASFSAPTGGQSQGYALSVSLPQDEGTVILLTWTNARQADLCQNFMLSFIDGLNIDAGSYRCAGPVTEYAYPSGAKQMDVALDIDGKHIRTQLRENDRDAAQALVEREYQVLCHYQQSNLWKQAWQRFYRMVYRDSFHRLQKASFDIYNVISPSCKDDTDLAQKLLTWTQSFTYEREKTASDFASLPGMLCGEGSDCDSRSMLLAVLLNSMNMDAVLFVSEAYSHALAGFVSTHPGHSFTADGKEYLMGETTAPGLTWGKIPQDMDNQDNWITVQFQ